MKCMCAQTRPRFILSSEGVLGGKEFEPMLTPREMSPEEGRTSDTVDSEPKHYQLSYSGFETYEQEAKSERRLNHLGCPVVECQAGRARIQPRGFSPVQSCQ